MTTQDFKQFVEACREAVAPEMAGFIETSFQLARADEIMVFVPRRVTITRENAIVEFTPDLETAVKKFLRKEHKEGFVYDVEPLGDEILMMAFMEQWRRYFMRYVQMSLAVQTPDAVSYEPSEVQWQRRAELREAMIEEGWQFQGNPIINQE